MCGIIGVIGGNLNVGTFLMCLEALATRGQEAAGLTGFIGGFISQKTQGTAKNLEASLPNTSEKVDICVASTRYPTIGSLRKESLHRHLAPFTESTSGNGVLSLAFNGNIIFPEVINQGNDGALLCKLLKENLENTDHSIYEAVQRVMAQTDGSYSVVAMLGDDKIIAFRDPFGIRPLCWGELDDGYVVTSETRILEKLGIYDFNFVPPGGLLIFSRGRFERHRIRFEQTHHCMFEWTYFSQAPSINEGAEVYTVRYNLGTILGRLLKEQGIATADYVIPVPNTSRSGAVGCADYLGLRYADGLIKNTTGRIFIKPKKSRIKEIKVVYETVESVVRNKKIILIDDSIVRGTTLTSVIDLLRKKGAKEIHVGITTPMIKYPCVYGIDMSRPGELLASKRTVEEIKTKLGCDSLTYMSIEGLREAIEVDGLCTACLDAIYPTPKARELFRNIDKMNEDERAYEQNIIAR
ncbi:MAG: amidophosphoribosyltransferase [Candidatus Thorarchaeota archaeon]